MGRKPKLFLPLTVTFFDDDRIIAAGDGGALLYLAMSLKAKELGSDGRLSEAQIGRLHRKNWRRELDRLAEVQAVVFDEPAREWFIAGWFSHNEPIQAVYDRREKDRQRKANSDRIPHGFPPDSGSQSRGKGKEGKETQRKPHRYVDTGDGSCTTCSLPEANRVHLRLVGEAS